MIEFRRFTDDTDSLFAAAYALYEVSFPLHEQRPLDKQKALMGHPLYHFDLLMDADVFAGILLSWHFDSYAYIEHFAINPDLRGKFLGSKSLEAFCANHDLVILEIDPPVDSVAERRERFYQKLGFHSNPYPHRHPPYRPGVVPHELVVMSYARAITAAEYTRFADDLANIVMADVRS